MCLVGSPLHFVDLSQLTSHVNSLADGSDRKLPLASAITIS